MTITYPINRDHTSPNQSSRAGAGIRMLVLHATVGSLQSSINWFLNPVSDVSSHYLIGKLGAIVQMVDDSRAAWHAGRSYWLGMSSQQIENCSLGIELENKNDGRDPYPRAQLDAAHWLCQRLIGQYEIERAYVTRHLDIAIPKGRKTDPAGFPWAQFVDGLYLPIPTPPHPSYRVRAAVTAGATVRSDARRSAPAVDHLTAGDAWSGSEVAGETVTLAPFGTSDIWICQPGRCVWSGLLQKEA